jgi:hypothetical protein
VWSSPAGDEHEHERGGQKELGEPVADTKRGNVTDMPETVAKFFESQEPTPPWRFESVEPMVALVMRDYWKR